MMIDEIKVVLGRLPVEHTRYLTHIWLMKIKKGDYLIGETMQGMFISGRGVL